jgi:transposase
MVFEHEREHSTQWATIKSIASKIGCTTETLRGWVRQAERDQGVRPGLTSGEPERLKELERENRESRRANEILRKASAFSRRRSSTADPSDGVVHRRISPVIRGRADLRRAADRPVDVLRGEVAAGRSQSPAATLTAGRHTAGSYPASLG